jgi:hypothetical protein
MYVEKLPVLYSEFAEAARHIKVTTHYIIKVVGSTRRADLMQKTPMFGTNIRSGQTGS